MRITQSENIRNTVAGDNLSVPLDISVELGTKGIWKHCIYDVLNGELLFAKGHTRICVTSVCYNYDLARLGCETETNYVSIFYVIEGAKYRPDGYAVLTGRLVSVTDSSGKPYERDSMFRFVYENLLCGNFLFNAELKIPTFEIVGAVYDILKEENIPPINPICL